jgi:hypothetical protein
MSDHNHMMPGSLVRDEMYPKSLGLVTAAQPGARKVKWIKDGYGKNFGEHYPHHVATWLYADHLVEVVKND